MFEPMVLRWLAFWWYGTTENYQSQWRAEGVRTCDGPGNPPWGHPRGKFS